MSGLVYYCLLQSNKPINDIKLQVVHKVSTKKTLRTSCLFMLVYKVNLHKSWYVLPFGTLGRAACCTCPACSTGWRGGWRGGTGSLGTSSTLAPKSTSGFTKQTWQIFFSSIPIYFCTFKQTKKQLNKSRLAHIINVFFSI